VFVGTLRDFNQGDAVQAMTLEHYAPMTQKHLERLAEEALARWPIEDVLVIHRYGELRPNDPIVCVAVWAAHRDSALDACRYLIDELKTRAPFWKQELTPQGRRWVAPEADEP
jgi:molybdopterin synthase catalytic subunit